MNKEKINVVSGLVEKIIGAGGQKIKIVSFKPALFLNDKLIGQFDSIGNVLFSPSGKHFAFETQNDDDLQINLGPKAYMSLDKKTYDEILFFKFSPDEKHLLWGATRRLGKGTDVWLDDQMLGTTTAMLHGKEDQKHFIYAFSPFNHSVAWIKKTSNDGMDVCEHLMIDQLHIYTFAKRDGLRGLLWLMPNILLMLKYNGDVYEKLIGSAERPCKLLLTDVVRLIATPDNKFIAIKKFDFRFGLYTFDYNNTQYQLHRNLNDLDFEQTQIKVEERQVIITYPDNKTETIAINITL